MNLANFVQKLIIAMALLLFANFALIGTAHAKKSFLEGMMPFLYDRGSDEVLKDGVLTAPFADSDVVVDDTTKGLPQNAIPLDQPHRSDQDITSWVVTAVSQALTFNELEFQKEIDQSASAMFSQAAAAQYKAFLADTKITEVLSGKRYRINSFTQGRPLLMNEGALKGRYRWLYEVSVMVSYMDRHDFDYSEKNAINQTYKLQIQVGHVKSDDQSEGVVIENWTKK